MLTFAQKVKVRNYIILIKAGQMTINDVESELQQYVTEALS